MWRKSDKSKLKGEEIVLLERMQRYLAVEFDRVSAIEERRLKGFGGSVREAAEVESARKIAQIADAYAGVTLALRR